jgi:GH15 family glucan-1,4-alpha-glucosidase
MTLNDKERELKIRKLLVTSKQVLLDCCLENGAVVAANTDKAYYPSRCQCYRFVWPTDAAYILLALKELGVKNVQEPYFSWLWDRCEDVKNDGLLFQNYYTNGIKRWTGFQPDANAKTLWLLHDFFDGKIPEKWLPLAQKLADGLLRLWNEKCFSMKTQDRWEDRNTYPDLEDNHTYTLAACIKGLTCALSVVKDDRMEKTIKEMRSRIDAAFQKNMQAESRNFKKSYFFRTAGKFNDPTVDASVLGLVWPFGVVSAKDERMKATVQVMESSIVRNGGVLRYEGDRYDCWTHHTEDRRKGGGAWPILNCFMALHYLTCGEKKKAFTYLDYILERFDDYIPEQVFENKMQVAVSPLAWSHAMIVFVAKELQ